ncbi:MAG: ABC transporter permease [Chloroflexi bacterium]|nr:ABC transporter permease [Chloroflexota bacterium]
MHRYILRRLAIAVPTLIGITILIFLAMRVLPGDPLATIESETVGQIQLTPEQVAKARASLGLDRPYHEQYLSWMRDVLSGNFGTSFWRGEPLIELIARRAPISIQIALMAVVFALLMGVPLGMLSAARRNAPVDYITRVFVTIFQALPSFLLGMVFILVGISFFDYRPPLTIIYFWQEPTRNLEMTIGPALALGLGLGAFIARIMRSATLEVLNEDYVRTARAKGLEDRGVLLRHVLKNSLLPVVTVSGLALGGLIGGSVAVERAFGVPGLGLALVMAVTERDWMLIQNLVLFYGIVFVIVNLLVDLSYAWIDPRIHYG